MVQEGEVALTSDISLPGDMVANDDSLVQEPQHLYGIVLTPPDPPSPAPVRNNDNLGVSFILCGVFLLFFIVALRIRNNMKYAVGMFHNLIETRTRQNVFDDTVRETSLIVLLNILWCVCTGILGYSVYQILYPGVDILEHRSIGMLLGMAIAAVYSLFLWGAYSGVGWVFSDRTHAELWVKGFSSSQALMTPAFFIFALLGICQPESSIGIGIVAASVFICAKLIFIWKGFRIFFNQFSSWVLFLCYLCSLEIVPLILCYRCAVFLGKVL